jgi:uncharacterized protein (TIGR02444 family)
MRNGNGIVAAKTPARNGALWRFACRLYARPGVVDACLALQDRHGADVPLLLAALWHGASGRGAIGAARAARWRRIARVWRETAVRPLRLARRALKPHESEPGVASLRTRVKAAELAAEKLQLAALERDAAAIRVRDGTVRRADAETCAAQFLKKGESMAQLRRIISALEREA